MGAVQDAECDPDAECVPQVNAITVLGNTARNCMQIWSWLFFKENYRATIHAKGQLGRSRKTKTSVIKLSGQSNELRKGCFWRQRT
jgi:hypothetical protein